MIVAIKFLKCVQCLKAVLLRRVYNTTFGLCESTYGSVNSKHYHPLPPPSKVMPGGQALPTQIVLGGGQDLMEVGKLEKFYIQG